MWASIGLFFLKSFTGFDVNGLVASVANVYSAKVNAGTDKEKIDADLVAREVQLAQRESELQASLAKGEPGYVRQLFAYPVALYYGKLFLWDKVLGLGVTDPLSPQLTWVAQTIIVAYFGSAAIVGVVRQINSRV